MERKRLFGTSGIRGYTNTEITPMLGLEVGMSFGAWIGGGKRVVVGRDTRNGASAISHAVVSGLASVGVEPTDCGCLPTPALATYAKAHGFDGCVMVTGSHMPPDRIGIIPMLGDGSYLHQELSDEVEKIYRTKGFLKGPTAPEKIHAIKSAVNPLSDYLMSLLALISKGDVSRADLKVLVDPGNGTGCGILAPVIKKIGCEVIEINEEKSGNPNRSPEPRDSTLGEAKMLVKERNCDLACCLDLDSDRVVFVDETGTTVSEDVAGIILAEDVFRERKGTLVTPVNSSGIVDWFCRERGIDLVYCKVGQPETVRVIKEVRADYAYEESGKYYFSRHVNWCDGILASLKVLEALARTGKRLSELVAQYPEFHQVKEKINVPDRHKGEIMQRARSSLYNLPGVPILVEKDGLKLVYGDDSWLLLRASGTEPLIRIFSDSRSLEQSRELVESGKRMIEGIIEELEG